MQFDFLQGLNERVKAIACRLGAEAEGGLPVVRVAGLGTVEVGADDIAVMTRMRRADVLKYDFSRLCGREFEAYGAKSLSEDLLKPGETAQALKARVSAGREEEVCFSFPATEEELPRLVEFLKNEGFFAGAGAIF